MPRDLRVLKALILGILLLASFSSGIGFGWFKRRFSPRGSHQRNASNDSQLISTTRIPIGLVNLGNTCYLNSVLQGLFHTKEFRDELLRLTFTEGSPGYWLQDIFRDLEADDISEGKGRYGVNPSELIRACNINFNIQEDAEEFFLNLLDKIDGSLESKDSPLPSHCFQSNLLQNTTCLHVEFTKSKMLKYLDFAIENSATVEEGIFKYFQKELLNGDSKIKAGDFGRQEAERTLFLQRPPRNMVLQLKRFGYDVEMDCMVKLHDRIEFPEELDLSIIDKNIENASLIYDLYGVVVHDGDPTQGHYTFFGRQLDKHGEWFYLNDQSVERCSWERVQEKGYGGTAYRSLRGVMGSCNSYLLFYKQRSATTPH